MGIFSRWTKQTQEAWVYSHDGPSGCRKHGKRGYILTMDQSDAGRMGIFSRRTNQTQSYVLKGWWRTNARTDAAPRTAHTARTLGHSRGHYSEGAVQAPPGGSTEHNLSERLVEKRFTRGFA
eukprot:9013505-Pyramimonas_sp.AAC.1